MAISVPSCFTITIARSWKLWCGKQFQFAFIWKARKSIFLLSLIKKKIFSPKNFALLNRFPLNFLDKNNYSDNIGCLPFNSKNKKINSTDLDVKKKTINNKHNYYYIFVNKIILIRNSLTKDFSKWN